jgi:beta-lactamase regulating signal transducer with metallopeptidase domain
MLNEGPDLATFANEWAEACFAAMVRVCLVGGLSVILVYAVCRACPRLPIALRCWLWWLVCLEFVVGLFWRVPLALPLLPPVPKPVLPESFYYHGRKIPSTVNWTPPGFSLNPDPPKPLLELIRPLNAETAAEAWSKRHPRMPQLGDPYWTLPAMIFLIWTLCILVRVFTEERKVVILRQRLQTASDEVSTSASTTIEALIQATGLRAAPKVVYSPAARVPYISGLIRPVIVLPPDFAEICSEDERRMALAHELTHLQRRDLWLSLVPLAAHSLFCFFPLTWLARREWSVACEAACDQKAMELASASPQTYAQMLLKVSARSTGDFSAATLGVTAGYPTLKRRLASVVSHALSPVWRVPRPVVMGVVGAGTLLIFPWRIAHQGVYSLSTHFALIDLQIDPRIEYDAAKLPHPNRDSEATAINDSGQIAGTIWRDLGRHQAFCWDRTHGSKLLGILEPGGSSEAAFINSSGTIVGRATWKGSHRAFIWGAALGLQTLESKDCFESSAESINDRSEVVGSVLIRERDRNGIPWKRAALWDSVGRLHLIPTRMQPSTATSINNRGQIVGYLQTSRGPRACIWDSSDSSPRLLTPGPEDVGSQALAIDSAGNVTGLTTMGGTYQRYSPYENMCPVDSRAFRWTAAGGIENLGTLPKTMESVGSDTNSTGLCGIGDSACGILTDWSMGSRSMFLTGRAVSVINGNISTLSVRTRTGGSSDLVC